MFEELSRIFKNFPEEEIRKIARTVSAGCYETFATRDDEFYIGFRSYCGCSEFINVHNNRGTIEVAYD